MPSFSKRSPSTSSVTVANPDEPSTANWMAAAAEGKRLADYDYFRSGTEYNAADCRSMSLVLAWLREHR